MKSLYEPGQWIYGVVTNDEYEYEVAGYLYMAECRDYIICCSEYSDMSGDFRSQLDEMYNDEQMKYGHVEVSLLKKDMCFATKEEADEYLSMLG